MGRLCLPPILLLRPKFIHIKVCKVSILVMQVTTTYRQPKEETQLTPIPSTSRRRRRVEVEVEVEVELELEQDMPPLGESRSSHAHFGNYCLIFNKSDCQLFRAAGGATRSDKEELII